MERIYIKEKNIDIIFSENKQQKSTSAKLN